MVQTCITELAGLGVELPSSELELNCLRDFVPESELNWNWYYRNWNWIAKTELTPTLLISYCFGKVLSSGFRGFWHNRSLVFVLLYNVLLARCSLFLSMCWWHRKKRRNYSPDSILVQYWDVERQEMYIHANTSLFSKPRIVQLA